MIPTLTSLVTMGKLLILSDSYFLHLDKRDHSNVYLTALWIFNAVTSAHASELSEVKNPCVQSTVQKKSSENNVVIGQPEHTLI